LAERRSKPRPVFVGEAAIQAEALRRQRFRGITLVLVLLGFAALLYALTVIKLL
jgi:hypothetical protein